MTFQELEDIRVEQSARLSSYGWTDEANGFASIPIDEAKKELISRINSGRAIFSDMPGGSVTAPPAPAAGQTEESAAGEVLNSGEAAADSAQGGTDSTEGGPAAQMEAAEGGH